MIPRAPVDSPASRWAHFAGLYPAEGDGRWHWLRDRATVRLPALAGVRRLALHGEFAPAVDADFATRGRVGLQVRLDGREVGRIRRLVAGPFGVEFEVPTGSAAGGRELTLELEGVTASNACAWLARVTADWPCPPPLRRLLERYRRQPRNRQLRITALTADDETVFDFTQRDAPFNRAFARRHFRLGLNVVGFHTADLGIGESARCMVRAADAAGLPVAVVPLRLNCLNPQGDDSLRDRLQDDNPHPVNVVHVDAPQSRDLDHHHGPGFRAGKYNIAYWAWELPEFPDAWLQHAAYFDEIWTPSAFVREAVAAKLPHSVHTMPHAIGFERPPATAAELRSRFRLPTDRFLFLFVYDLNSYSDRKNPAAVLEACRRAFAGRRDAGVVIKTQNRAKNPEAWARLEDAAAGVPGAILLGETLPRRDVYALQAACDAFVSLHRSEGFGLAVAESMYLGKPVIATDWSGTAEYLDSTNGCPVRCSLVTLERDVGPYARGQTWAEPDVEHAAWWMTRLLDDPGTRASLGAAARATIERRFAPAVIGARYRRRLEAIASW